MLAVLIMDRLASKSVIMLSHTAYMWQCKKVDFFKFWWDSELDNLKMLSIDAHSVWKQAGKPKSGPVYDAKQISHANYKLAIHHKRLLALGLK